MTADISKPVNGQCLCGAVKFTVELQDQNVHACHCSMCCSWAGGPFLAVNCTGFPVFESDTHVGRYSGSAWGERVFCTACGSSLFWQTKNGEHVSVAAGLVDLDDDARMTLQFFIDEKPAYVEFAGESKRMTGAEVFAAFAGSPEG